MFKNEFQGGIFLDILSVQGKDFTSRCKIVGSSITGGQREFEKSIRSNVLVLEGESTRTKIIIPKDEKSSLYILQPYLVFQLNVLPGVSFSLEAVVTDTTNQKRRILMSTSYREISVTAFHVKIPLSILKRGTWLNLCLDLASFVGESFKGQKYKSLESIIVCANCKLRRIFSMKTQPRDNTTEEIQYDINNDDFEEIPKSLQFAVVPDSQHFTQVLNMKTLINSDIKFRIGSGIKASNPVVDTDAIKTDKLEKTHIAFGSRVTIPKHAIKSASRNASDGLERQLSSASLSSSGGLNSSSSHVDLNDSVSSIPQLGVQKPILQPRPPKPGSGKTSRRPNPRIRSAENAKVVKRARFKSDSNQHEKASSPTSCNKQSDLDSQMTSIDKTSNIENDNEKKNIEHKEVEIAKKEIIDENNNKGSVEQKTETVLGRVSQRLVVMKMGSQDDEEDYFRIRKNSENQEEVRHSKDESFSSSTDSDALFLYSSRPRSVSSSARNRKSSESSSKNIPPPQVVIDEVEENNNNNNDDNKGHRSASLESDFHRQSPDSEIDDPLEKFHRLEGSQRNSPRVSPLLFSKTDESMVIKSSLLKEIPKPNQSYNHLKYQSVQSDSMSWMYDSDSSQLTQNDVGSGGGLDNSMNEKFSPIKHDNDVSPRNQPRLRILDQLPEGMELGNDSDDVMSDASDETSYSTWKAPPSHLRNYRYQDEMHGVGMTLDLSATLPMTPFIEEKSLIKEKATDNTDSGICVTEDSRPAHKEEHSENENELDLLYDPVLNCYYDAKTHKYYVLA